MRLNQIFAYSLETNKETKITIVVFFVKLNIKRNQISAYNLETLR